MLLVVLTSWAYSCNGGGLLLLCWFIFVSLLVYVTLGPAIGGVGCWLIICMCGVECDDEVFCVDDVKYEIVFDVEIGFRTEYEV